jgi:hypothetical protein
MNFSKVVHRGQGVGVVVAQCLLAAGQGLLEQLASALEVPEAAVGLGEVIMEVGVVVAQHSPVADQGLLVQPAGALWIPQASAGYGEIAHRGQCVGVLRASTR